MPVPSLDPRLDERRFFGIYRGVVNDVDDPKMLGRVRAIIPEVYGPRDMSPWAAPKTGFLGGGDPAVDGDKGDFMVPDVGDGVWFEFEAGDSCRPVWSGRWWAEPGNKSEIPELAKGGDEAEADDSRDIKGDDKMTTAIPDSSIIREPNEGFAPEYPHNRVIKTKQGIIFEMDDTEDHVRIHIYHPEKSWIEILPDGTTVQRVAQSRYTAVMVDDDLHVKGDHNVSVEGAHTLRVIGDMKVEVLGNIFWNVAGNWDERIGGSYTQVVQGMIRRESATSITDKSGNNEHL